MRHPRELVASLKDRSVSVLHEFFEFYQLAFQKSKVWTVLLTLVFATGFFDELRMFLHGHGILFDFLNGIIAVYKQFTSISGAK